MVHSIRRTRSFVAALTVLFASTACGGDGGNVIVDPELGGIRGSVVNETNVGVANATLTATKGTSVRTAATASNGDFSFSSLESGSWALVLALPTGFELATGENGTRTVTVVAGQNAQVQTFTLRPAGGGGPTTGTVSGRVTAAGAGVANALIALTGVTVSQTTNANGDFSFASVIPGPKTVTITVPAGFTLATGETAQKPITVTAGQTATVNWSLQAQTGGGTTNVSMQNEAFVPPSVTVQVGGAVRWTNQDVVQHNVTGANNAFTSTNLNQNGTFTFTFNTAGTFNYECTLHPGMNGSVTVNN